ncbi:E3 ubiquitin-protein ligase E3D [Silurus asotus]|uniref:E3 ubiquitin-protein ligase E3D n=1 Tax=Silurus asotus TaxID=30991 RepID=A0AAD4ZYS2_SILAS|nr:E3 ubiquitin-protein ligase E3D [Silurus asotus]
MEASTKQDLVFVELRERLQSGLFIVRTDVVKDKSEVSVTSGDSALKIHIPDGIYEVKLPPEVSLVERSCPKSPELNADGLHVRVRLKVGQCPEAQDSAVQHLRAQRSYCFLCQSCGAVLLKDRVFRRVLPLPNGNWNTLVDDWCCHPDPFANKKLHPQQQDCLLGDTYFLLTRDSSCDQSLTNGVESSSNTNTGSHLHSRKALGHRNVVVCKNCCAVLGEAVTTGTMRFSPVSFNELTSCILSKYLYVVKICSLEHFLERVLSSRLVELSSAQSIFRFSIQTPDGTAVIMLWLLNMDTLIASFSEKAISGDILVSASDRHPNKHQSCQAVRAIKVLYFPCTHGQQDEAVQAWEKDISVHPLILPRSTCGEVLQLLKSSTATLPSSLCSMNIYQVRITLSGYLSHRKCVGTL